MHKVKPISLKLESMPNDLDPFVRLEAEHHKMLREDAERALGRLSDGDALNLRHTYGELLQVLLEHVGERGVSEGAVDTLRRIIQERDHALSQVGAAKQLFDAFAEAGTPPKKP